MTDQGNPNDSQTPVFAQPGSPLTCFGVNQSATKLYFISNLGNINELAQTENGWRVTDVLASPFPKSQLTCYGFDEFYPRIYYIDFNGKVTEAAWRTNQWNFQALNDQVVDQAMANAPLTCVGRQGKDGRLYYVTVDSRVHELAADDSGSFQDQELTGASVAFGSGLTCKQDSRGLVTVFYIDQTQSIHFIGYIPGLPGDTWEDSIKDTAPAPGSALTCFTKKASNDARVYYLDHEGQINEVTGRTATTKCTTTP